MGAETPMMACGCLAQAVSNGEPICAIHLNRDVIETPDLTGRRARCYCGREEASTPDNTLAFFEYTGPGSAESVELCGTCGYHAVAHGETNKVTGRPGITDHEFVGKGPAEFDRFYCGHSGWD